MPVNTCDEPVDLGYGWTQCGDIISKYEWNSLTVVNLADFRCPEEHLRRSIFGDKRICIAKFNEQPRNWFGTGLQDMIEMQRQLNESIELHFKHINDSAQEQTKGKVTLD